MDGSAGPIPEDPLVFMACSIDTWVAPDSEDKRRLRTVLAAYRDKRASPQEPVYRRRLAQLYSEHVPRDGDQMLTPAQRDAVERCALGEPFSEDESQEP